MKRKLNYDQIITILVGVLLIVHLIFNLLFQSGDNLARIILIFVAIIAMKIIFSITFIKRSKIMYVLGLGFIMMAMYLGNVLNIYTYISFYDKILHLSSGIILGILGFIIYVHFTYKEGNKLSPTFALIFALMFSIAMAGVWEIWEFSTDQLFGLNSQHNSLFDTMLDIICGTIGGVIILPSIYMYTRGKKTRLLKNMVNEIIK